MDKDKWNKLTSKQRRRRSRIVLCLLFLLHESPPLILAGVFASFGQWEAVALTCVLYLGLTATR